MFAWKGIILLLTVQPCSASKGLSTFKWCSDTFYINNIITSICFHQHQFSKQFDSYMWGCCVQSRIIYSSHPYMQWKFFLQKKRRVYVIHRAALLMFFSTRLMAFLKCMISYFQMMKMNNFLSRKSVIRRFILWKQAINFYFCVTQQE